MCHNYECILCLTLLTPCTAGTKAMISTSEQQRQKTYLRTCAPSETSDQPAHIFIGRTWIAKLLNAALRKHAYSNILKILQPEKEKISDKKF